MDNHLIRSATKSDCSEIARLYSIASDGVANYVWSTLAEENEDIFEVGKRRYERKGTAFSYENCTVVEFEGEVVGMLVAFPMHCDNNEPPETDPVLAPYSALEEDNSYYVCGIAMFPQYRGRGIGSELMSLAEKHAMRKGYAKISLVVFEENSAAKKLYERLGYIEKNREAVYPHPLINISGDALLMVKPLSPQHS